MGVVHEIFERSLAYELKYQATAEHKGDMFTKRLRRAQRVRAGAQNDQSVAPGRIYISCGLLTRSVVCGCACRSPPRPDWGPRA